MTGSERSYAVALASCPGLEPGTLRRLVAGCNGAGNVWNADAAVWRTVSRLSVQTVETLERWRSEVQEITEVESNLLERSVVPIVRGDLFYPSQLLDLPQPPEVLFVRGSIGAIESLAQSHHVVSVVGTRRASSYGLEATRWIASTLASRGWHVVSGLAAGVDVNAHESTVASGGLTSAVLACGVDLCYPVNHKRTYEEIIRSGGCIISEYPPGTLVAKHRFLERNRLIAALGRTLIVVQAGDKSGALTTAGMALDLGRDIYAVPGPITSVHYQGSNRLLADGAFLLLNPEEFLLNYGQKVECAGVDVEPPVRWRALYEALTEPLGADMLARVLGMPVSHVYAGLLELELEGWIERHQGAVYGRKRKNLHPNSAGC